MLVSTTLTAQPRMFRSNSRCPQPSRNGPRETHRRRPLWQHRGVYFQGLKQSTFRRPRPQPQRLPQPTPTYFKQRREALRKPALPKGLIWFTGFKWEPLTPARGRNAKLKPFKRRDLMPLSYGTVEAIGLSWERSPTATGRFMSLKRLTREVSRSRYGVEHPGLRANHMQIVEPPMPPRQPSLF